MIIYIFLIIEILFLYPFFRKKKILSNGESHQFNNKFCIFVVSTLLVLFLGLRGLNVGIDTNTYFNIFNSIKILNFAGLFELDEELGFTIFQFLVSKGLGSFQYLLIIVAALYIGVVSYHIYKYSENPSLSYLLFIIYGFYSFAMSAIRQSIAIALVMIAYEFIKEKKIIKFLFFVLLASSFHITALIFLPCYWLNKFKLNRKTILLFIIIGFITICVKDQIRLLLNSYSRIEYAVSETGGNRMYVFMLISTILGAIFRKPFIAKNENNKYLFYMMVCSVVLMPITKFNPVVMRLYLYYFIFMIIYIPNILCIFKDKGIRFIGSLSYFIIGSIWFFTSLIYTNQLETYLFFWQ